MYAWRTGCMRNSSCSCVGCMRANQAVCAYARCPSGDPISMDARHQPLITPSASPPLSRSTRVHKRRKIAPSPLSSTPIDFDLDAARRNSSRRVLDVWNQLAGRYSRRLDEDDIVDLRTVSLVKDRGVIRASSTKYDFGFLTTNDAISDAPEDDLDELDALAEGVIPDQNSTKKVPPLQPMDPADAEDLRLFLEAENRRKAECGDEDDADGGDDDENEGHGDHELVHEDEAEDVIALSDNDSDLSDEVADDPETYNDYQVPLKGNDRAASTDVESEDELGKWESDEGTKVYKIEPHEPESDSDIEIIQAVISDPSRPSAPSPCAASKPNQKPPLNIPALAPQPTTQLYTPPQSSSSVLEPTPDDRASELPTFPISSALNSHPRPRPIPRKYVEEEQPVASASSSPVKLTVAEAINSAAKGTPSPRKSRLNLEVVVPRLASLKPKRGPIKAVPRTPSPPLLDTQPTPPRANESSDSEIEFIDEPPRLTAREKGKAKATSPPTPASELERVRSASSESDDPLCIVPSSSPSPTKPVSPNATPREKTSLSSSPFWTPSPKPRPARTSSVKERKRKRAYSSSPEGFIVATEDRQPENIFQPDDVEAVQPIGLANVEASPSPRVATVEAGIETPTRPSACAYAFQPCYSCTNTRLTCLQPRMQRPDVIVDIVVHAHISRRQCGVPIKSPNPPRQTWPFQLFLRRQSPILRDAIGPALVDAIPKSIAPHQPHRPTIHSKTLAHNSSSRRPCTSSLVSCQVPHRLPGHRRGCRHHHPT